MEITQGRIQSFEERGKLRATPFIPPNVIANEEWAVSSIPPTRQTSMAKPSYDKRPDCTSCITMGDEPSTVDVSTERPRCGITKTW